VPLIKSRVKASLLSDDLFLLALSPIIVDPAWLPDTLYPANIVTHDAFLIMFSDPANIALNDPFILLLKPPTIEFKHPEIELKDPPGLHYYFKFNIYQEAKAVLIQVFVVMQI